MRTLRNARFSAHAKAGQALRRADACLSRAKSRGSGQALAELAIMGSLFILILGALISYGLKYSYQQQVQQTAFRRALQIAADPDRGQGGYMMIQDKYTPDPSHMYGIGTTQPISSSASVTRDYQMFAAAQDASSLPTMVMDVKVKNDATGKERWERRVIRTSGFRLESDVPHKAIKKYQTIFGSIRALNEDGNKFVPLLNKKYKPRKHCSPAAPAIPFGSCVDEYVIYDVVRIMDSCSGDIVDYKTCYKQARMLVDSNFCTTECILNKTPGADINCSNVCAKETHPPNQTSNTFSMTTGGAWYAANWTSAQCPNSWDTCYTFPVLDQMFSAFGSGAVETRSMGMQGNSAMDAERSTSINRTETPTGITTQETANWSDRWRRAYVIQNNLCPASDPDPLSVCNNGLNPAVVGGVPESSEGYEKPHALPEEYINITSEEIESVYEGEINQTWETNK